jgi:hypothetical protein
MNTTPINHDPTDDGHRAACAECAAVWDDLERISAQAAQLPRLTPSRDLWAGIEARIAAPSIANGAEPQRVPGARSWYRGQAFRLALAASLLVAVSSAVTWKLARADREPAALATLPSASPEESALHLASFTESVTSMEREISALQTIVRERRAELDPQTVSVLEENLAVIDRAIAESRAALASDPASQFLAAQFARAYSSKLTLLRDATTLPIGI